MNKKITLFLLVFVTSTVIHNTASALSIYPANKPEVTTITQDKATVSLSWFMQNNTYTTEQKQRGYFSLYQTNLACPAIYPIPEYCQPTVSPKGATSYIFTNLKPDTEYNVVYKGSSTIYCITTPCPTNEFQSEETIFKTKNQNSQQIFTKNLFYRMRDPEVGILQSYLIEYGYLQGNVTNFFGIQTLKAVKQFQKDNNISPTGFVGPKTRSTINNSQSSQAFTGIIESISTNCYADGECSVTIDGKKVVTTIGWKQGPVGTIKNYSIGDLQNKIGKTAKVYAKQTVDGYTLYGNTDYYIEVLN